MRKVAIATDFYRNYVLARAIEKPISAASLDKRSEPQFEESSHKGYTFNCIPLWAGAIKGKYKIMKTTVEPAKWVKSAFKLNDPADFKKRSLPGINKTKVLKYASFLKKGNVDLPPVLFAKDAGSKKMFFIDGNHRLMASFLAGIKEIPCYQFDLGQLLRSFYTGTDGKKHKVVVADKIDEDIYE